MSLQLNSDSSETGGSNQCDGFEQIFESTITMKPAMPLDEHFSFWMVLLISQSRHDYIHPITQTGIRNKRYCHKDEGLENLRKDSIERCKLIYPDGTFKEYQIIISPYENKQGQ